MEIVNPKYPQPRPTGGRLIRKVVKTLRTAGLALPVSVDNDSHILCAVSGGPDSVALAHLLVHYGRRIAPKGQVSLLHINHHWRGEESEADARFVEQLAQAWGVRFIRRDLAPPPSKVEDSLEELARRERQKIYADLAGKNGWVLTGHHADDLAETLLWRLFTGSAETHGLGIRVNHGCEWRPFLEVRKNELKNYLKEEGVPFREDSSNQDVRFLRNRMRKEMLPMIEAVFPKAIEHLVTAAKRVSTSVREGHPRQAVALPELLFQVAGVKTRRPEFQAIEKLARSVKFKSKADLANGSRLIHERESKKNVERWILECRPQEDVEVRSK